MKQDKPSTPSALQPDAIFEDAGFVWPVSASGYSWNDLRVRNLGDVNAETRRVLTDETAHPQARLLGHYRPKQYRPLLLPKDEARRLGKPLFVLFSELDPTEEAVTAFANKWGLLTGGESYHPPQSLEGTWFGEEDQTWYVHIRRMNEAVGIWKALRANHARSLRKSLRWTHDRPAGTGAWHYEGDLGGIAINPPTGLLFSRDDPFTPAWFLVQRWINEEMWGRVSSLLLWNPEQHRRVMRIMPHDLLGAMWLQFARAIAGEVKYGECKTCRRWLTISKDRHAYQANREFCSAACRQKDHRRKVKEARQLKAGGKRVRDIARHFETTPETINNWLAKEK